MRRNRNLDKLALTTLVQKKNDVMHSSSIFSPSDQLNDWLVFFHLDFVLSASLWLQLFCYSTLRWFVYRRSKQTTIPISFTLWIPSLPRQLFTSDIPWWYLFLVFSLVSGKIPWNVREESVTKQSKAIEHSVNAVYSMKLNSCQVILHECQRKFTRHR